MDRRRIALRLALMERPDTLDTHGKTPCASATLFPFKGGVSNNGSAALPKIQFQPIEYN